MDGATTPDIKAKLRGKKCRIMRNNASKMEVKNYRKVKRDTLLKTWAFEVIFCIQFAPTFEEGERCAILDF